MDAGAALAVAGGKHDHPPLERAGLAVGTLRRLGIGDVARDRIQSDPLGDQGRGADIK
jgi:hypothetical protein